MIEISNRVEYDYIIKRGYQPLLDWRMFKMDFQLRKQIQYELFGAVGFQQENQKLYKYCWDNKPHICEEIGKPLHNYSAVFISHIISRGSDRRMSCDPRNINILSFEKHQQWESERNKLMNIYPINKIIIQLLKSDYA